MRSKNLSDRPRFTTDQGRSGKQTWWKEEIGFEIERLKSVLRNAKSTNEEKAIAQSQIANYQEISVMATKPAAEWLQQICLLAS